MPQETQYFKWVQEHAVEVRPSSIPGAGLGVFARVELPANRLLGVYKGRRIRRSRSTEQLFLTGGEYCLQLGPNLILDAENPAESNWTRYLNCIYGPNVRVPQREQNCEFTPKGHVKTLCRIQPGEELFISYGPDYWKE